MIGQQVIFAGLERLTGREIRLYSAPIALRVGSGALMLMDTKLGDWMAMARNMNEGQCLVARVNNSTYIAFDRLSFEVPEIQERLLAAAMGGAPS